MTPLPAEPLVDKAMAPSRARALPYLSVSAGSLVTILPVVASAPLLPPFGLLMLLAWRLLAPLSVKLWAPALLGLFDDLVSGQPLGSAMLLWQTAFFIIAIVDQRTMFRDFWQDWAIAAGILASCLLMGRAFAVPFGAHVDSMLLAQWMVSVLVFPLCLRLVAWIDVKRGLAQ